MAGPDKYDSFMDRMGGDEAQANVAAAQGVAPEAAARAFKSAPATGVEPTLGMTQPEFGDGLAEMRRDSSVLDRSPSVRSFAAVSPAHVAASKGDWGTLAGLADAAGTFTNNFADVKAAWQRVVKEYTRQTAPGYRPAVLGLDTIKLGKALYDTAIAGAADTNPGLRALLQAPQKGAEAFVAGVGPAPGKTPEESVSAVLGAFNTSLLALGPGRVRGFGGRAGPIDEGTFGTQARIGGSREVITDVEFEPLYPPGVRPQDNAVYAAGAEVDAAHVAQMEEAVAGSATHSRLPALMEEYLNGHTPAGAATVYVDAEAIARLRAEGYEVFPQVDVDTSLRNGADVAVPLGTYLTDVSGKPYAEELRNATRFREEGVSVDASKELPVPTELPDTFYHGTSNAFDEISKIDPSVPGVFVTDDPTLAGMYATGEGGNIRPVRVGASNPLHVREELSLDAIAREAFAAGHDAVIGTNSLGKRTVVLKDAKQVRSVFDREPNIPDDVPAERLKEVKALAARVDATVEQVFKENSLDRLFTDAKAAGLPKGLFERYGARVEEARGALADKLLERTYTQLRRERTPEWKAAVAAHREVIRTSVEANRALNARAALQYSEGPRGEPLEPLKLDRAGVVVAYGQATADALPARMFSSGGVDADAAGELLGYASGDELLSDMLSLEAQRIEGGHANGKAHVKAMVEEAAQAAARAELGYDVSFEGLLNAAREAVVLPEVEDLLIEDLRDLGELVGLPLDKAAVEYAAKQGFDALPVRQALQLREFERTMKRLGEGVEKALLDDNPLRAWELKQKQLLNWYQLKQAHFLSKRYAATEKKFRGLARKKAIAKLAQPFLDQIHAILPGLGYATRRDPAELAAALDMPLAEFVRHVVAAEPSFPAVPEPLEGDMRSMRVDQFWNVRQFVYALDTYGREVKSLLTAEGRASHEELVDRLIAHSPRGKVQAVRLGGRKTFTEKLVSRLKAFDASHRKIADIGEFFDQGALGVMNEVVETPMEQAANTEGTLRQATYKAVDDAYWAIPAGVRNTYGRTIAEHPFSLPDGTTIEVRRGDVPAIALYAGTESGLAKLSGGYGTIPPEILTFLDAHITAEEAAFVQTVWDKFEELSTPVSEVLRAMTGTGLEREPPRAWVTSHGTKRGGYWPVKYDKALDRQAALRDAERAVEIGPNSISQLWADIAPSRGFSISRTGYEGPVLIRLSEVTRAFDNHIKYAAYARPVASVRRFINDPRVRELITTRMGEEYYSQYAPWLDSVVLDYVASDKGSTALQALANASRRNMTVAALGFSYTTGIAQAAGLLNSIGVVGDNIGDGTARMAWGIARFARLAASNQLEAAIFSKSEFMRQRHGQVEPNMAEAMEATQNFGAAGGDISHRMLQLRHASLAFIGWAEFATASGPTWVAAEAKALGQLRLSPTEAVAYADRAVRKSQGSGRKVDLAAVQRGDGFQKWFYMFNTFFNAAYQRIPEIARELGRGGYGKAFGLFATFFVAAPLVQALVSRNGPKDLEPETLVKWAVQSMTFNLARPVFGFGNLASSADRNIEVRHGKWGMKIHDLDFSADPFTRSADALWGLGQVGANAAAGKETKGVVRKVALGVGIPLGVPGAAQLGRSGQYLADLLDSTERFEDNPLGILAGPKPQERRRGRDAR